MELLIHSSIKKMCSNWCNMSCINIQHFRRKTAYNNRFLIELPLYSRPWWGAALTTTTSPKTNSRIWVFIFWKRNHKFSQKHYQMNGVFSSVRSMGLKKKSNNILHSPWLCSSFQVGKTQECTILWLSDWCSLYIHPLEPTCLFSDKAHPMKLFFVCLALLFCETALRGMWCNGHTLADRLGAKQIWKSIYFRVQYSKYFKMDRKVNSNVHFCMLARHYLPWSVERETKINTQRCILTTIKREKFWYC